MSSLSLKTNNLGFGSGLETTTDASPELSLPPSSLNLRIYSPSSAGRIVSLTLPANSAIRLTELENLLTKINLN